MNALMLLPLVMLSDKTRSRSESFPCGGARRPTHWAPNTLVRGINGSNDENGLIFVRSWHWTVTIAAWLFGTLNVYCCFLPGCASYHYAGGGLGGWEHGLYKSRNRAHPVM